MRWRPDLLSRLRHHATHRDEPVTAIVERLVERGIDDEESGRTATLERLLAEIERDCVEGQAEIDAALAVIAAAAAKAGAV
jgi:hypothetical protein